MTFFFINFYFKFKNYNFVLDDRLCSPKDVDDPEDLIEPQHFMAIEQYKNDIKLEAIICNNL